MTRHAAICAVAASLSLACVVRGDIGGAKPSAVQEDSTSETTEGTSGAVETSSTDADRDPVPGSSGTSGDPAGTEPHFDLGSGVDVPDEDASTDDGSTGDATINSIDCCTPSEHPGCPDAEVETCVCNLDAYCCDVAWDDACVELATWSDCYGCMPPEPPPVDDCCLGLGGRGCADEMVEACVCEHDPYCCMVAWDEVCAEQIDAYACGACA